MVSFDRAVTWVIRHEGGFVCNPHDPGGATKYGISKRSYPSLDIENLTLMEAQNIYAKDYWIPSHAGDLEEQIIATKYFDICVNMGVAQGCKTLQLWLTYFKPNAYPVTSIPDRALMDAVNQLVRERKANMLTLAQALGAVQFARYFSIISARSDKAVFAMGWAKRAFDIPLP